MTYFYTKFGAHKLVHPSTHPRTFAYNLLQLISKLFNNTSQTSSNTTSFSDFTIISLSFHRLLYFISPDFSVLTSFPQLQPSLTFTLTFFPLFSFFFRFDMLFLQCLVCDSVSSLSNLLSIPPAVFVILTSIYFLCNVAYTFSSIPAAVPFISSLLIVFLSTFRRFCFYTTSFPLQLYALSSVSALFLVRHILSTTSQPWFHTNRPPLLPLPIPSFLRTLSILSVQNFLSMISRRSPWSCTVLLVVPILSSFPSCPGSPVPCFRCSRRRECVYFQFKLAHLPIVFPLLPGLYVV